MIENILQRQKKRESLVTLCYTVFSVFLVYVIVDADWTPFIIPVIAIAIAFVWWSYITQFSTYDTRAVILALLSSVNIVFYGVHGLDFTVLIPTLGLNTVLFAMLQVHLALDIVIGGHFILMMYHLIFRNVLVAGYNDPLARDRAILQMLSLLVLTGLCIYMVYRRRDEEKDFALMEERVVRAQKIKDDFVANTSHELRTPIHTISGMSEILLQENLSEEVHRAVADIQMTGLELQTLITDILDYAALESDTLTLSPRSYNITSTLNDVMNMTVFQNREKRLELIFDCDPGIPCLLYGDETQIRRVINNLIGNAVKFTFEGGIIVTVHFRKEEYGGNLIVRVKDSGIGMSTEEQERIFQEFYQADAARNRLVEGMGLGLTISAAIIKKMGGFMTVKSNPGRGSEFSFSVPQKIMDERPCVAVNNPGRIRALWYFNEEKADTAVRDDFIAHIRHIADSLAIAIVRSSTLGELKRRVRQMQYTHLLLGTAEYREDPLYFDELALQMPVFLIADRELPTPESSRLHILYKPYNAMTLAELFNGDESYVSMRTVRETRRFVAPDARILVVDDNIMNLKVVEGLLRRYRIRITAATSGEEALEKIESKDYDFVFMDHMMPGMDGIECFHRIRAKHGSDYYMRVPVIALTANAIAGSREMFLEEGFDDFVAKPIDNALLDQILKKYIPAEKQIYEDPDKVRDEASAEEKRADDFGEMEGIDMETALTYCGGDINDFIDLATVYLKTGDRYYPQLLECYAKKDWKNYAIYTHAIKSTSKTIGAMKLSDIAYKEEMAAKEEDEATITQYHGAMLDEYRRVLDVLAKNPRIGLAHQSVEAPATDLSPVTKTQWKKILSEMKKAIGTFEADAISNTIDKYKNASYQGKAVTEWLQEVADKANAFDFESAGSILSGIGEETK